MNITQEEINKLQGTRLSNKAPWETYNEEMGAEKLSPELQEQIKRYEERRHHKLSQEAEEELARQKELSDATSNPYRWVTKEEYEYVEPRIGKIIHSTVFLNMLRKECGLDCWYAAHPLKGRLKLIVNRHDGNPPKFACWLQEGFQIEYSLMKFDEHNVPLDEKRRGWRTCLMQILLQGILSEETIERVFGKATGPASKKYNSLFYEVRNKRVKAKEE